MLRFSWLTRPSGFTSTQIPTPLILPLKDCFLGCILFFISAGLHYSSLNYGRSLSSLFCPPCSRTPLWSLWQVTLDMVAYLLRLFPSSKSSPLPQDGVQTLLTGHARPCLTRLLPPHQLDLGLHSPDHPNPQPYDVITFLLCALAHAPH